MSRIIDSGLEEQSTLLAKMGELTYETLALSNPWVLRRQKCTSPS